MADPYEIQVQFVQQALLNQDAEECHRVFYEVAKRDIRKAVYYLLQPEESPETSLANLVAAPSLERLELILRQYCPNKAYQDIVHNAAKNHPFALEKRLLERLQKFKRAPRTATLLQIWGAVQHDEGLLLAYLQGLQFFSHELVALWEGIDEALLYSNKDIVNLALELLIRMPQGIERSLYHITHLLRQPEWQFKALQTLQHAHNLPQQTVRRLILPILDAYRKDPNRNNNLWPEFRLIQSIARNNRVHLTIPDIDLGRF